MNGDGQGSTKYKRPCISENIFLKLFFFFFLFKSKTNELQFSSDSLRGPRSSFLQMLRECAKLLNAAVEEPGGSTKHRVCGVLGLAWVPLPSAGGSPAVTAHFTGDTGSFPLVYSCTDLHLHLDGLVSSPALFHLRSFSAAMFSLVLDVGCKKERDQWQRSLAAQSSGPAAWVQRLLGWDTFTSTQACPRAHCKWTTPLPFTPGQI